MASPVVLPATDAYLFVHCDHCYQGWVQHLHTQLSPPACKKLREAKLVFSCPNAECAAHGHMGEVHGAICQYPREMPTADIFMWKSLGYYTFHSTWKPAQFTPLLPPQLQNGAKAYLAEYCQFGEPPASEPSKVVFC